MSQRLFSLRVMASITVAALAILLASCDREPTGFQPGIESLPQDTPAPSEPLSSPPPAPIVAVTPEATPEPTSRPTREPIPTPTSTPVPAPLPTPTSTPVPTPLPTPTSISLSLALANDQSSSNSPTVTWPVGDPSRISYYKVALGTSMGATDVLDWRVIGYVTSYQVQDGLDGVSLDLDSNQDYYFSLRAVDPDGQVIGAASSQAWFIYAPYTFGVSRYCSVSQDAKGSFWGVRHPDPRYAQWDDSFEAYVSGSAALDLYRTLGERVLTGSSRIKILQTESDFPKFEGVIRLGPGEANSGHADTVASMLYDCEISESRQSYYRGCQTNPRKYAMTSMELGNRLNEFLLTAQNVHLFESAIFGEMQAPQVWSLAHAHPTSVDREGPFEQDQVASLRLGDWMFSHFNILAISPQPGSYAGNENPTLSGNYYNSIVVGKKSYIYTYPAQSSIDNVNGPRYKPDIVIAASNLAEASSWSVPTMAAAVSAFLGLADTDRLLSGAAHMQTMKAIILAGAGKDHLCPESIIEVEGFCNGLPSRSEQWQWSNSESSPLDPTYGVGLFNYRNSFKILTAGRSVEGTESKDAGWDTQELAGGQRTDYTFTVSEEHDAFSLALTWNRDITVGADGTLTSHLADFKVELRDQDGAILGRSDDPGNNIEHIYIPSGLSAGQTYTITVTLKSSDAPVRYGLAWQVRNAALPNSLWREG